MAFVLFLKTRKVFVVILKTDSTNHQQGDIWDEIEDEDKNLEQTHPAVLNRIEGINGQFESLPMKAIHPIVSEPKEKEPDQ